MEALRRLNSQHGLQPPDVLATIWRGEDHWLFERWIMPNSYIFLNLSLANCNFSGGSQRTCACRSSPFVAMNSSTPSLGDGLGNEGIVTSGKSASNLANLSSVEVMEPRWGATAMILYRVRDVKSKGTIRRWPFISTRNECARKNCPPQWLGDLRNGERPPKMPLAKYQWDNTLSVGANVPPVGSG